MQGYEITEVNNRFGSVARKNGKSKNKIATFISQFVFSSNLGILGTALVVLEELDPWH